MTLVQLRSLIAILDAGLNISQAAHEINATQPGLSKQLRQVELELGFEIFQRRGKQLVAVSPRGLEVIQHARDVLAEFTKIQTLKVRNSSARSLSYRSAPIAA
jgi:LysR family cys regulon transcriptional activator